MRHLISDSRRWPELARLQAEMIYRRAWEGITLGAGWSVLVYHGYDWKPAEREQRRFEKAQRGQHWVEQAEKKQRRVEQAERKQGRGGSTVEQQLEGQKRVADLIRELGPLHVSPDRSIHDLGEARCSLSEDDWRGCADVEGNRKRPPRYPPYERVTEPDLWDVYGQGCAWPK